MSLLWVYHCELNLLLAITIFFLSCLFIYTFDSPIIFEITFRHVGVGKNNNVPTFLHPL